MSTWATWRVWSYGSSSTSTSTCCDTSWGDWCSYDTSNTTSTSAWATWTSDSTSYRTQYEAVPVVEEDPEVLRRRREEQEKQARERERAAKKAEAKANTLLRLIIGPTQWKIYRKTGRIIVQAKDGQFLIEKGGKVTRIERDKLIDLCVHLERKSDMPATDNVVALALWAAADGYRLKETANVIRSRPRTADPLPEAASM